VLATCNRTEFLLWASDVTLAANSVMRLLGSEYGLKLCEWKHFYRLLDEARSCTSSGSHRASTPW
jgi:AraC-like DNA-binding protein